MSTPRTLLLLRHAEAEATRPGFRDRDRRLTEHGRDQAAAVGETIGARGWVVDHVLCSSAVRTQETLAGLALSGDATVETTDTLYEAGTDSIVELIAALPDDAVCALVVGHAPGVPGVLHELVDATTADRDAWAAIADRFPPATLAALALAEWADPGAARLLSADLTD